LYLPNKKNMIIPEWFTELSPITQALLGGLFTWGVTALGAALVFFTKTVNDKLLDSMMGFAAGVMIAASFWSLLVPAIDMAEAQGVIPWLPAVIGFLGGGVFLRICDAYLPHLHIGLPKSEAEGVPTSWRRSTLLVLAITLHNIPEGLAIGVLFGAAASGVDPSGTATVIAAVTLAIGIGIQNFPEGVSVSLPLRRDGLGMGKSFWYGQLSGFVEPISAVIGAAAVILVQPILPYALAFAAGAMIFVVVEELIPESQQKGNADIATIGTMIGFAVMMTLDVALG
jgi:ZIP family zinc transporter